MIIHCIYDYIVFVRLHIFKFILLQPKRKSEKCSRLLLIIQRVYIMLIKQHNFDVEFVSNVNYDMT